LQGLRKKAKLLAFHFLFAGNPERSISLNFILFPLTESSAAALEEPFLAIPFPSCDEKQRCWQKNGRHLYFVIIQFDFSDEKQC
jgi:hypothetical protein